ncbi:MAG: response regulator [Armatimonadetes bacterium]|nr:response regulator [Armatimonadota bacterium]
MKVLVVDDEPDVVEMVSFRLRKEGYEVISAHDGPSGVAVALAKLPDLIILDVMMPGIDGFQVFDRLKADQRTANIPVVMLTAKADSPSVAKGWMQGVDSYITKPFDVEDLVKSIKGVLAFYGKEKLT